MPLAASPLPCATSACFGYTTLDRDPDAAAAEAADSAPATCRSTQWCSLDVQAGGLLLAAASRGGSGNAVASWNGVDERYEQILNEGTLILTTGGFAEGLPAGPRTTKVIITKPTYPLRAAAVSFH